MEDSTPSIVVILCDDGRTVSNTVSYDNFIKYDKVDDKTINIHALTTPLPHYKEQVSIYRVHLENNKHVFRAVQKWAKLKKDKKY